MNRDAGTYTLSHLYDALFSATATSCGENRNRKSFRQRQHVNNKQERSDLDLIILIKTSAVLEGCRSYGVMFKLENLGVVWSVGSFP